MGFSPEAIGTLYQNLGVAPSVLEAIATEVVNPLVNIHVPNVVGFDLDGGDKNVDIVVPIASGENPIVDIVFPEKALPVKSGEVVPSIAHVDIDIEFFLVVNESLVPDMIKEVAIESSLHECNVSHCAVAIDHSSINLMWLKVIFVIC